MIILISEKSSVRMAIDLVEETEQTKKRKKRQEELDKIFEDVMKFESDYEASRKQKT